MTADTASTSLPPAVASGGGAQPIPVYVWQVPVRLTHWAIVVSIVVASFTGFFIANPPLTLPGSAGRHVSLGLVKVIHSWAAIVLVAAVVGRTLWGFTGNRYARWSSFLPWNRQRLANLFRTFAFYTFLRKSPPPSIGHNGLASVTYLVVFCLYLLMILSGLALLSASAAATSYLRWFAFLQPIFGGLARARFLHHVGMWLLLGFFAHHVWSAFLISNVERNGTLESIFSGYKFIPRDQLDKAE
jgi:Ni/Fe-hydrogenase 1 B-type cytochrome subunit